MKVKVRQIKDLNGDIQTIETPYGYEDYIRDISDLEEQVTPRRIREAVLTEEGAEWLANKEAEIQVLRDELAQLGQ